MTVASRGRFHDVGANQVRHLRDGREAFPAMLEAIDGAEREILLEMYWIGGGEVGTLFRDRLRARASAGVAVFVSYDGVGSLGLFRSFWAPLVAAGGHVVENGPVAPWRRRFDPRLLPFRDHRKLLVVDGRLAFCGGLNLSHQWLPHEQGGADWRDDVLEVRGPVAVELRALARQAWLSQGEHQAPAKAPSPAPALDSEPARVSVLANRVQGRPNRRIRRAYLLAIRRAQSSIDITNPYFLPGPLFLRALRKAHGRGVRVRLLVPSVSDVWLVRFAMRTVVDELARAGIEVYTYQGRVLHAKTAVLDQRLVVTGSHNLDAFSWRFDLEANLVVQDRDFALEMTRSFELDLEHSMRLVPPWRPAPIWERWVAWLLARLRPIL
jgi:cardiolipin synthase